jgi:hypothetical protein
LQQSESKWFLDNVDKTTAKKQADAGDEDSQDNDEPGEEDRSPENWVNIQNEDRSDVVDEQDI